MQKCIEKVKIDEESCVSCGACIAVCKTKALSIGKTGDLSIDRDNCLGCKLCIIACPLRAIAVDGDINV